MSTKLPGVARRIPAPGGPTGTAGRLFRTAAVRDRRRRLAGSVAIVQPPSLAVTGAVLMTLFGIALVFLARTAFPRTETVPGFIGTTHELVQLRATRPGRLLARRVHLGDRVEAGDDLFSVATGVAPPGAGAPERLRAIDRRRDAIEKQRIELVDEFTLRDRLLQLELERAVADGIRLAARKRLQFDLLAAAAGEQDRLSALARDGFVASTDLVRQSEAVLAARATLLEIEARHDAAAGVAQRVALERQKLTAERRRLLAGLDDDDEALLLARYELESAHSYSVRAPVAGTVVAVQGNAGQDVGGAAPLVTLLPEGAELVGILLVPPHAVGFLAPGDDVRLDVAAFPRQAFGPVAGRLVDVSRSTYGPAELRSPAPFTGAAYKATVALDRATVAANGEILLLQPDMTLSAIVTTERRTLLQWLLTPLRARSG